MRKFIELLKTQEKWQSLTPEVRKTTLEQINAIIKKESGWELKGGFYGIKSLLRDRCFNDIYFDIVGQIMECDFGVISVFDSLKFPSEIKQELKAKNIGIMAVQTRAKSYELKDIFGYTFLMFARSRNFDLYAFLETLACKYSGGVFAYAKNHKPFLLINAQNKATFKPKKLFISDILNFHNGEIDFKKLALFSSLPSRSAYFEFRDVDEKTSCWRELLVEIFSANGEVIGSIGGFTARTLWFDNYDKNSYFKE